MRFASVLHSFLSGKGLLTACCLLLAMWSVPITGNETFSSKPPDQWSEQESVQVLNDSPWAHTVTTTVQDAPCTYLNPAFEGLFPRDTAERMDLLSTPIAPITAKPDGAKYLLRLTSAKPVQAAVERLLQLDPKWRKYLGGGVVLYHEKPTDFAGPYYNHADLITIGVILERPGPNGSSFLDYAFGVVEDKITFPGPDVHVWPCAGLRTVNGQVHAVLAGMGGHGHGPSAVFLSFPGAVDGKPLISHANEKLEFRFIANQRVFETTFTVNVTDLLDGTEKVLHEPALVPDSLPSALQ